MSDQHPISHNGHGEEKQEKPRDVDWERLAQSWGEVGNQVQDLFGRIASAFRNAWSQERPLAGRPSGVEDLRGAADRLERLVKQVSEQTEQERRAAMEATRQASEQSMEEARQAAISGLRILNEQINRLLRGMEQEGGSRPKGQGGQSSQEPPRELPPSSGSTEG